MESIDIVTVAPMAGRRAAAMQTASVRARCGAGHERQQETVLSLIELLVAMTVAAVLLSVAIPSYSYLINASRLTSTANDFVAAVNQARLGAIKRNGSTQFCSNVNASNGSDTLGSQCSSQAGAVVGQLIDADGNTIASRLRDAPGLPAGVHLGTGSYAVIAVRFGGQGLGHLPTNTTPYTGLLLDIYSDELTTSNHRCLYLTTGSVVRSCSLTISSGGCPADEPASCPP